MNSFFSIIHLNDSNKCEHVPVGRLVMITPTDIIMLQGENKKLKCLSARFGGSIRVQSCCRE